MNAGMRKALKFLLGAQNSDGGWPYVINTQSYPESTCYSLLALSNIDASALPAPSGVDCCRDGLQWLCTHISSEGALLLDNDTEPHWGTSLALLTLSSLRSEAELQERCARWLLSWEGLPLDSDPIAPMEAQLIGWPWIGETFSWVEPTSYAMLALKRIGFGTHPRVSEAEQLLLDRACVKGGWNYGNRIVFDQALSAFAPTTAVALMALQDSAAAGEAVEQGLVFLDGIVKQYPSTLSLSLAILCFDLFQRPTEPLVPLLLSRQQADGSWRHSSHLTALSVLALQGIGEGRNVFKL